MSLTTLELANVPALLANLNVRTEKAGPEVVPAADLHFEVDQSSDVLAFFGPTMKATLFDDKALRDLADGMPLRFPDWKYPISTEGEMTGAKLSLAVGVGEPIAFAEVKVNQFKITPVAGGSVRLGFRIQCKPDANQVGRLYMLQEQKLTLSLDPAELPEMGKAAKK